MQTQVDKSGFSDKISTKISVFMYKYILIFPIDEDPYLGTIRELMDKISIKTGLPPLYKKMCPHVTFHRPLVGINESVIRNITEGTILTHLRQTRISISNIHHFGKQYIVLPVHATKTLADFWVNLNSLLSQIPEYEHGAFDSDNTLHITVAEKTHNVFDFVWGEIRVFPFEEMDIPLKKIRICRKPVDGGVWDTVKEYQILK